MGGGNIYSSPATKLDEELSSTSTNAVQNKVINSALNKKLNVEGFTYKQVQNTSKSGTATAYYTNLVTQKGYTVNDNFSFLDVQYSNDTGGKVSITPKNLQVHRAIQAYNEAIGNYRRVTVDSDGLYLQYSNDNFSTIKSTTKITLDRNIKLSTVSDTLTIPSSIVSGYEKKLKFNNENIATEDYVDKKSINIDSLLPLILGGSTIRMGTNKSDWTIDGSKAYYTYTDEDLTTSDKVGAADLDNYTLLDTKVQTGKVLIYYPNTNIPDDGVYLLIKY